jgi:hypothetical protein
MYKTWPFKPIVMKENKPFSPFEYWICPICLQYHGTYLGFHNYHCPELKKYILGEN